MVFGSDLGLPFNFCLTLGVFGVVGAAAILIMRLRPRHDEEDDGATV